MDGPVLLIGCGKMGGAMLDGWLDGGLAREQVLVVEPARGALEARHDQDGLRILSAIDAVEAALRPAVVVLAVKPQAVEKILADCHRFVGPDTVFLSIVAGKRLALFEEKLGPAAIVRAMPNTPAAIGQGMTVACANASVTDPQRTLCQTLLEAVGDMDWVEDEALLDAVTAVSGSGPAYVFLFAECLAQAGIKAGLPADLAWRLARATLGGSGTLLQRSDDAPDVLRQNVTSPGGTTEAALDVLMAAGGLQALLDRAVAAATARSRDLGGE